MHWDFFTVLSVLSGIVLIVAALGGPVVGTGRERLGIFVMGAFSVAYGIWVASQASGFYLFSVAPAGLAVVIVIRAVQHAGRKPPVAQRSQGPAARPAGGAPGAPGAPAAPGALGAQSAPHQPVPAQPVSAQPAPAQPASARPSALRAAQPARIREAVTSKSTTFCPAFLLPGSAQLSTAGSPGYYHAESLALGWPTADGRPQLPDGEELLGVWQASVRVKVAVGTDLNPAPAKHGVSWVTVVDGTGLIALSRFRVVGVAVRGDSLLGTFGQDGSTGIALWSLPLLRISSVADAPGGGLLLSSAEPAGHVTLTGISAGEVAGMINWARGSRPAASNAGIRTLSAARKHHYQPERTRPAPQRHHLRPPGRAPRPRRA